MATTKECNEYEIVRCDRIDLVSQANRFVETIVLKQTLPLSNGAFSVPDLSEDESRVYTAALLCLEREFNQGASGVGVYDKKLEHEVHD